METVRNPPTGFEVSSFDKLVQEIACRLFGATDSPGKVTDLVQLRVVNAFVNRVSKETFNRTSSSSGSCDVEHPRNKTSKLKTVLGAKKKKSNNKRKSSGAKSKSKNTSNKRGGTYVRVGFHDNMSSRMKERIEEKGGSDMKLVIVKKLYKTDLNEHHDRLSIPDNQIKDNSFLTGEETRIIADDGELSVTLMEPCEEKSRMVLVKWKLTTTDSWALRTSWKAVLRRNHGEYFKVNDVIQLWSFRVRGELWLAIDKIWDAPSVSCMKELELETDTNPKNNSGKEKETPRKC